MSRRAAGFAAGLCVLVAACVSADDPARKPPPRRTANGVAVPADVRMAIFKIW